MRGAGQRLHPSDHPRACGANPFSGLAVALIAGSSPRVRGKQERAGLAGVLVRIIPARAGQTEKTNRPAAQSPDHPRACGANVRVGSGMGEVAGSSPRVRGKLAVPCSAAAPCRIIPARAGQTRTTGTRTSTSPDHPRACGANHRQIGEFMAEPGSSPRVRGKLGVLGGECLAGRIIPARAGQTFGLSFRFRGLPDHPRACGANDMMVILSDYLIGSSPRVRGKPEALYTHVCAERIIPARAGQTRCCARQAAGWPDHPRACGANCAANPVEHAAHGSSPRVRGKPRRLLRLSCRFRIIPARAGQTRRGTSRSRTRPDHPRACGANGQHADAGHAVAGSSPRVRGKRRKGSQPHNVIRIIPARAGQTSPRWWAASYRTDHPRACGANRAATLDDMYLHGSSPRVRGKQDDIQK